MITEFVHDADGNAVTRRAKNSTGGDQNTLYAYDALGRLTNTSWADGEGTVETYDLGGNKISTTQRNGTVLARTYDDNGRLTALAMTLASGVVGPTSVTYEFDGAGRIIEAATEEASGYTSVVERSYNTLGKIEEETQVIDGWNSGDGRTITYTYNVKGQKTATEYPVSGDDITYVRDDLDRVDRISLNTEEVVDYTYLGSRVIKKEFPGSSGNRDYDAVGRLTSIHHKDTSSGNTLAKFDYELDDGDMIIEWDRFYYDDVQNTRLLNNTHDKGSQFAHDGAGRLVTSLRGVPTAEMGDSLATNLTDGDYDNKVGWVYDQVGSRLTQRIDATVDQDASYDEINALTTLNASARSRDTNGNFDPSAGGTYAYDYRNQLGKLSVHANGRVYEWHHDAFGRTIDRDLTNGSTGIRTYFDGDQIAERVSFNSAPNPDTEVQSREFVFGAGADELLLHIPTSVDPSDRYYAHSDQASSVQVLADETGAIQESYRYEEFGDPELLNSSFALQSNPASIVKNPFRFTGRPYAQLATWDGEQWHDMGARHYNSTVGVGVQSGLSDLRATSAYDVPGLQDPLNSSGAYRFVPGDDITVAANLSGATLGVSVAKKAATLPSPSGGRISAPGGSLGVPGGGVYVPPQDSGVPGIGLTIFAFPSFNGCKINGISSIQVSNENCIVTDTSSIQVPTKLFSPNPCSAGPVPACVPKLATVLTVRLTCTLPGQSPEVFDSLPIVLCPGAVGGTGGLAFP